MINIRRYQESDFENLILLIEKEGISWQDYYLGRNKEKYQNAISRSLVLLIFEEDHLVGYLRCKSDDGYGIYVYDLLVDKSHRGKGYGQALIEKLKDDFQDENIYIMSDVDEYYEKSGFKKIGSIFTVNR